MKQQHESTSQQAKLRIPKVPVETRSFGSCRGCGCGVKDGWLRPNTADLPVTQDQLLLLSAAGTGDPEVPEEPDDLDASAEARSSDHVGLSLVQGAGPGRAVRGLGLGPQGGHFGSVGGSSRDRKRSPRK